ncbi:glycosyltransferase involved in cell wall biosynthesis [Lysobacter niabensis]|uniref:Glycosyltransferase involved in cell wall biosynthesis n=1 Tax=Agrilutibacter niabensis TaxID=380628 RepID=A0ABU1VTZ4_9GAMM|nr:glycosyltransferase family 2 protein [Lysobacter niabensis]MDR7100830.1 glycosyltransferase involved in cell wall biosynthesis [Lysobacter niabensis]
MTRSVTWTSGIAVVIPSYNVVRHIAGVIDSIGPEVDAIYCVDDACPNSSGDFVEREIHDPRVRVIRHPTNLGVGGAVMTGYRQAIADGARVIVKIDGDGQMDPTLLPNFVAPILLGEADYTKGNRFWDLSEITRMPVPRRIGNLGLSFMAKASAGYWDVFDPTNGYTAIHADVAARLPYDSISQRYFFETDILFRLNTLRAVVVDVPMDAKYGDEVSGLKVSKIIFEFAFKHLRNFGKRIAYNYFLRDLSIASLELLAAIVLLGFGGAYGGWNWLHSFTSGIPASTGTVMISVLSMLVGIQFLLAFLGYDIANMPRRPMHPRLGSRWTMPMKEPS